MVLFIYSTYLFILFILFIYIPYYNYSLITIRYCVTWSLTSSYFFTFMLLCFDQFMLGCFINCVVTNTLHTLYISMYHYDCFYICKDLTEGEINQSINQYDARAILLPNFLDNRTTVIQNISDVVTTWRPKFADGYLHWALISSASECSMFCIVGAVPSAVRETAWTKRGFVGDLLFCLIVVITTSVDAPWDVFEYLLYNHKWNDR